jgi:anti-sigma B factor antagonist
MLEVNEKDGVVILKFEESDRFNAIVAEQVRSRLLDYFSKPNTKLIFNLEGIRFIDSSGFSAFLSAMKAANNNYGQFKICNVDEDVKELFRVLQLHNVFDLYGSVEEALGEFE